MEPMKDIVCGYKSELRKICADKNLRCLSDYTNVTFDGDKALEFVRKNCSAVRAKVNKVGEFDYTENDIYITSGEIKFCLANIFLFKDTAQPETFFFLGTCFEKLYNFWDRIGDLLNLCFQLNIAPRRIYFGGVIPELKKSKGNTSPSFNWLDDFSQNEYPNFNKERINIVHNRHMTTNTLANGIRNVTSLPTSERSQEIVTETMRKTYQLQIDSSIKFLVEHKNFTMNGFEHAIRLISEIT